MELKDYIKKCGEAANHKGWIIDWEHLPEYLMATIHELTDGFDKGWRDNYQSKMEEELGDAFIRWCHIVHDLNIDIEPILSKLIQENEKRPFKHGRVRM